MFTRVNGKLLPLEPEELGFALLFQDFRDFDRRLFSTAVSANHLGLDTVTGDLVDDVLDELSPLHAAVTVDVNFREQFNSSMKQLWLFLFRTGHLLHHEFDEV